MVSKKSKTNPPKKKKQDGNPPKDQKGLPKTANADDLTRKKTPEEMANGPTNEDYLKEQDQAPLPDAVPEPAPVPTPKAKNPKRA